MYQTNSSSELNPTTETPKSVEKVLLDRISTTINATISKPDQDYIDISKQKLNAETGERILWDLLLRNMTIGGMRKCVNKMAEAGLLTNNDFFDKFKNSITNEEKTAVFPDLNDNYDQPLTEAQTQLKEIYEYLSAANDRFEENTKSLTEKCSQLGEALSRIEIVSWIASNIAQKYEISDTDTTKFMEKVRSEIKFNKGHSHEIQSKISTDNYGNITEVHPAAIHSRGSTDAESGEIKLDQVLFLNTNHLGEDISIVEHELIHLLKSLGIISLDINVPIASMQTVIALRDFNENEAEQLAKNDIVPKNLLPAQIPSSPLELFKDAIPQQWQETLYQSENWPQYLVTLQKLNETALNHESEESYRLGFKFGLSLLEKEKEVGSGYAQAYIVALAYGKNPVEAEFVAQYVVKSSNSFKEADMQLAKLAKKVNLSLEATYDELQEQANSI